MKEETMRSFGRNIMSFLAVLLVAMSASWAGPQTEDCGQVNNAVGQPETSVSTCMDELLEAQLGMINAVEDVATEMQGVNLSFIGAERFGLRRSTMQEDLTAHIQLLRDEHGRAMAANKAVEEADYEEAFANADQEKGKNCGLSDLPFKESLKGSDPPGLRDPDPSKFGDGKCNVFSAIVDIPGAPNDGDVVHVNERRENMCEKVCADRVNPNPPPNTLNTMADPKPRKQERKERVVRRLTDDIDATVRATGTISGASANLSALRFQLSRANFSSSETSDICVSGFDLSGVFVISGAAVAAANSAASFVTAALEIAKDNAEPPANQTVAGFNAGAAVSPFAIAAGISKLITEALGIVEKALVLTGEIVSAFREDTLELCLKSVRDNTVTLNGEFEGPDGAIFLLQADVADLKLKAGEAAAELAAIKAELAFVKSLLETTRDLLLTPQGQREGFNKP
jgi:hypothetical protein